MLFPLNTSFIKAALGIYEALNCLPTVRGSLLINSILLSKTLGGRVFTAASCSPQLRVE